MDLIEMYNICSFELSGIDFIGTVSFPHLYCEDPYEIRGYLDYLDNPMCKDKLTYSMVSGW